MCISVIGFLLRISAEYEPIFPPISTASVGVFPSSARTTSISCSIVAAPTPYLVYSELSPRNAPQVLGVQK
jgi:hypothetical protein